MYKVVYLPTFKDSPSNPARANLATKVIEINAFAWQFLDNKQREFVMQHEIGHLRKHTFDESVADKYALDNIKIKKNFTLQDFLECVKSIAKDDPDRERKAEIMVMNYKTKKNEK